MTPKEKASRLVADFIKHSRSDKDISPIQSAKQCALIAVDEILNAINPFGQFLGKDFWQEVKKEINLL